MLYNISNSPPLSIHSKHSQNHFQLLTSTEQDDTGWWSGHKDESFFKLPLALHESLDKLTKSCNNVS